MPRSFKLAALAALTMALGLSACHKQSDGAVHVEGATMGTTWHATILTDKVSEAELKAMVQSRLDELEGVFTNWRPNSPVSRFNASADTGWQAVPRELAEVVTFAQVLSKETGGSFDVTATPLIDLWGFGAKGRITEPPSDAAVEEARGLCGWQKLEVRQEPPALRKIEAGLQINVSALVEGYAIDELVNALHARGIMNFLLEVGGEVYASGSRADGSEWRVGVQQPDAKKGVLSTALPLRDQALATSGTYEQYREFAGKRESHILDARTGRPVEHSLVSVSVISNACFLADGWATALLTLGEADGNKVARRHGITAFFIEAK